MKVFMIACVSTMYFLLVQITQGQENIQGTLSTLNEDMELADSNNVRRRRMNNNDNDNSIQEEKTGRFLNDLDGDDTTIQQNYYFRDNHDLDNVCFNKHPPIGKAYRDSDLYVYGVHKELYPLSRRDYPIRGRIAETLKDETEADSPMTRDDYMLSGNERNKYCSHLKRPHHPSSDPSHPFWDELRHVVNFQYARIRNDNPSTLNTWPQLWETFNMQQIADSVKSEYPNSEQAKLIDYFLKNGGIEMDHNVMKYRSSRDAVGLIFTISSINSWVISAVSPITFLCKWSYGVPRPEEIAFMIAKGKFTEADGVPRDLVRKIRHMKLRDAFDFTAYKDEGSPTHPSFPAMHSSGSTLSIWLPIVANLTPEQYCEALKMDLGVAHARIVAGVHYYQDNFAGLQLGMDVLRDRLPKYLADNYHANQTHVEEKLDRLMFDWKDFDPKHCTIAGVPVGKKLESSYSYFVY